MDITLDITFRNHPAQARHPLTDKPLEDAHGEPVPLFPEMRAIYLDGVMCGYCSSVPGNPVTLTGRLPLDIVEAIKLQVANTFGEITTLGMPPLMPENPLEVGEETDDE